MSALPVASGRYRFFRWLCFFFFISALFVRLDVITIWPGAEAWALTASLGAEAGQSVPSYLQRLLLAPGAKLLAGSDLFYLFPRLLSACLFLAAYWLYHRWGSRLFGRRAVELQLMVAAASLWLPFFGKLASFDSWAFLGHLGIWLSSLLLLQTKEKQYQFYQAFFSFLAALVAPWATLLFLLLLLGGLAFWKSNRSLWAGAAASLVMLITVGVLQYQQPVLTYAFWGQGGMSYGNLLLYSVLASLPVIGYLVAGGRDLVFKWRQKEALAITLGIALVAAFAAKSLLFPFVLALVAGKQLQLFTQNNYPWGNWIKGAAVLHLIFAFIATFLALMTGLIQFRGEGYRAVLGMAAAYWIFSLLAVLGLYGQRRDFSLGGTILSGLLAVLFFWVQVYPFLEVERSWPQRLIKTMPAAEQLTSSWYVDPQETAVSNAVPYLQRAGYTLSEDLTKATFNLQSTEADTSAQTAVFPGVEGRKNFQLSRFFWLEKE